MERDVDPREVGLPDEIAELSSGSDPSRRVRGANERLITVCAYSLGIVWGELGILEHEDSGLKGGNSKRFKFN